MNARLLTVISTGITIGFLLAMGLAALSRSLLHGKSPELEIAFTIMVVMMSGGLAYYVVKSARQDSL